MRNLMRARGASLRRACLCVASLATLALGATAPPELRNGDYTPPAASRARLGTIPLDRATEVTRRFAGGKKIFRLPGGAVYIDADMDIDADGSPRAKQIDPCCGQPDTSLSLADARGRARPVNAETVPYVALPGTDHKPADRFFRQMGLKTGDIVAVVFGDKVEYAVFADVGPPDKIGEGSIALSQSLGHDPFVVKHGKTVVGSSIPGDVIYVAFPNSRPPGLTARNVVQKAREKGRELFAALGGNPGP
jgi:hypothetical protein